ncbi:hypothetical protein JOF29_005726 [Kribbella aluminosa]|uniref:Uncharacterized protein n=1 Tax=Kribbella aluminosa TaxID=416017 RepID=A0ABS4USM6_9ACTN|nr:hypothetical protein [Kribbella aluminosa]MBP2354616.1 hypothetical protein [Kribbella aluminosa]
MSELRGRRGDDPGEGSEPGECAGRPDDVRDADDRLPTSADRPANRVDGQQPVDGHDADRETRRPLTAREKLEQRLDEMYWPGYSSWSSVHRDETTDRRPRAEPSSTDADRSADARLEDEDPFASYTPELQAHIRHDDTLARLQYLSPRQDEADAESPASVESRDVDDPSSRHGLHDEPANGISPTDNSRPATSQPAGESDESLALGQPEPDDPAARVGKVEPAKEERVTDEGLAVVSPLPRREDVAAGIDSAVEHGVGTDELAEAGHEFVEDATPEEMDQYRRIRETDDLDALAENSELPRDVINEAKQHLFQREHDVAVGPGDIRHGYFTPNAVYGDLWEQVASGVGVTDENRVQFWSLLAHEYVESKLMEAGLPYVSSESGAWSEDGRPEVLAAYPSAHNVAPLSTQSQVKDLLRHWAKLDLPRDDLQVAPDLSNLDNVVRVARERLGL